MMNSGRFLNIYYLDTGEAWQRSIQSDPGDCPGPSKRMMLGAQNGLPAHKLRSTVIICDVGIGSRMFLRQEAIIRATVVGVNSIRVATERYTTVIGFVLKPYIFCSFHGVHSIFCSIYGVHYIFCSIYEVHSIFCCIYGVHSILCLVWSRSTHPASVPWAWFANPCEHRSAYCELNSLLLS